MGLYHEFQTAITFVNLLFVQIHVYKFEMVIQNSCYKGLDEDRFV